jgi:hypothetical protein
MESLKTSFQQEFEQLNSSLPGLELPPTSQAPSSLYADLEAMIETINAEYPMLDQLPLESSDDLEVRPPPLVSQSNSDVPESTSLDLPVKTVQSSSQKAKRRRRLSESKSADAPRKKRTPPGRINAPRHLNGRFLKLSERRTGKSLELVRQDSANAESQTKTSDLPNSAFTVPLPSELVNEIYNICIMPHLNSECMSEMEVLVRTNLFMKHYRPQLILFLASANSSTTYRSLDALVAAAIRQLGF